MDFSNQITFSRLWVVLLGISTFPELSAAINISRAPTEDCRRIANDLSAPFPCTHYDTKTFNGNKIDVYHYAKNWAPSPKKKLVMDNMFATSRAVIPHFQQSIPNLHVKFLLRKTTEELWGQEHDYPGDEICYVEFAAHAEEDSYESQHFIAHELGHCIHHSYAPHQKYLNASHWVMEGQPEYFANEFYPLRSLPKDSLVAWATKYWPEVPLYRQGYAASLFWHFLRWSNEEMLSFMKRQDFAATFEAEGRRISEIQRITEAFPKFAIAFLDKTIKFKNGKTIPLSHTVETSRISEMLFEDDKDVNKRLEIDSFTFKRYFYTIFPGSRIVMSWRTQDDGPTMLYRKKGSDDAFKSFTTADVEVGCNDEPASYEFLYVSTSAKKLSASIFTLKRLKMEDCPCEPNNVPLDPCLNGEWKLNIPSWKALYKKNMEEASNGDIDVKKIDISGSHTWEMTSSKKSYIDFNHLLVKVLAESDETDVNVKVDIDGWVKSDLVMRSAKGSMCLRNIHAKGRIRSVANGFAYNSKLDDDSYKETMFMTYKCTKKSLEFSGWYQGARAWGYIYDRAS